MSRSLKVAKVYIEKVKLASAQSFPSQKLLAENLEISRATVSKFLNGGRVDYINFDEISKKLGFNWEDIAEKDEILTEEVTDTVSRSRQVEAERNPLFSSANLVSVPPNLENWQRRDTEIHQLQCWLGNPCVKTIGIHGLSGVGKSRLASYIYQQDETRGRFDAIFWADVSEFPDFAVFAENSLINLCSKTPEDFKYLREPSQLINELLKCLLKFKCLLVVDNLETLLDKERCFIGAYKDFFWHWNQRGTPTSKLLLTTQVYPAIMEGEGKWLPLRGLDAKSGANLLRELGIQGDEADLRSFVDLVGGHPIMLRFVAFQLMRCKPNNPHIQDAKKLGLMRIEKALSELEMPYRNKEKVLFFSLLEEQFKHLPQEMQRFFINLSIYRQRYFKMEAAAVVLAEGENEADSLDTIKALEQLKGRSLLDEVTTDSERRFQFHPFVWQYAKQEAGERSEGLREKVIRYYQSMTTDKSTWKTLEDVASYLEFFYHQCEVKQYAKAFDTISICDEFLYMRGYNAIRVESYEQLVQAWKPAQTEKEKLSISLLRLGIAYYRLGKFSKAIESCQQSQKLAQQIEHYVIEADALDYIGNAYRDLQQYQKALEFNQQSLRIAKKIGYRECEVAALIDVGNDYYRLREYQKAIEYYQLSLHVAEEIDYHRWKGASFHGLGLISSALQDAQQAIIYYEQSLLMHQKTGDLYGIAATQHCMGNIYLCINNYQKAIDYYEKAVEIMQKIGNSWRTSLSLVGLGNTYRALEQYQKASACYQQVLEIKREMSDSQGEAEALQKLQEIEWERDAQ